VQPGKVASDSTNQAGQNAAGASGVSDSSLNLSNGATVAIIVVECLVVLGGGEQVFVQGVKVCSPIANQRAPPYSFTLQRNDSGQSDIRYVVPFDAP
jgi:hypothetical protein